MNLTSSMESFILAIANEGSLTTYTLRQAGISAGAAKSALGRLTQRGALRRRNPRGLHGKSEYKITKQGQLELANWPVWLFDAVQKPPPDVDSVFRLTAIALAYGQGRFARDLLRRALARRVSQNQDVAQPKSGATLASWSRWLSRFLINERRGASHAALRKALAELEKDEIDPVSA